jgi:hypothetical protein
MSPPAAGAAARTRHAEAAPLRLPPAPRRVSGPNRHPRAAGARAQASPNLFLRLIDHPWLERLVRGRAWIAIVATALLGIVAMQVALLRLGAQIGSATSAVNAMTAQIETTQTQIGAVEADHRLSGGSGPLGMVYPAPGVVTYLQVNPGDGARAVHTMTVPSQAAIAAARARMPTPAPTSANTLSAAPASTTAAATTTSSTAGATTTAAATGSTSATGATTTTGTAPATTNTATTNTATTNTATTTAAPATTTTAGAPTTTTATGTTGTNTNATPPAGTTTSAATGTAASSTTVGAAPAVPTVPAQTTAAGGTTTGT